MTQKNSNTLDTTLKVKSNKVYWTQTDTTYYLLIGKTIKNKKVRITSSNFLYISSINIFSGNLYLIQNNKRKLIKTISN